MTKKAAREVAAVLRKWNRFAFHLFQCVVCWDEDADGLCEKGRTLIGYASHQTGSPRAMGAPLLAARDSRLVVKTRAALKMIAREGERG